MDPDPPYVPISTGFVRERLVPSTAGVGRARLVVVTGAARGVGAGICRRVLQEEPRSEVVVTARSHDKAVALATKLGPRAHAVVCDVASAESCKAAAEAVAAIRRNRPLSLVNNAGVAFDLPWFPTPWPASAAHATLEVNFFGAMHMTQALLPQLLDEKSPGRVVFVSSGAGPANMRRMSDGRRTRLLADSLDVAGLVGLAEEFGREYEAAATVAAADENSFQLPFLSPSGLWLQSYGFSKACLNAYCRILAREHPSVLSVACSPGFVDTEMVHGYKGDSKLRSVDEGGEIPAWLACGEGMDTGCYYNADKTQGSWVSNL